MTDSSEALEYFRSDPFAFDMVITDMTMPGIIGTDLARELMIIRPDIPIIICTGFSELINEKRARELGIKGYITKPYNTISLNNAIRNVFAQG